MLILGGGVWLLIESLKVLHTPNEHPAPPATIDAHAPTETSTRGPRAPNTAANHASETAHPFAEILVSGRVFERETSRGIQGALVTIKALNDGQLIVPNETDGRLTLTTDAAGYYYAKGIPPGSFEFRAEASGFMPTTLRLRKFSVVEDDKGIDLALEKAISIEGRVLDQKAQPVAEAMIRTKLRLNTRHLIGTSPSVKSDVDGRFIIDPASQKTQALFVAHPEYVPQVIELKASQGASRYVQIILEKGTTIRGVVEGSQGPIEGARVSFEYLSLPSTSLLLHRMQAQGSAITNADGSFALQAPPGRKQGLQASADGYLRQTKRVKVPKGEGDITVDFELKPARTVVGQVKLQNQKSVGGAKVGMRSTTQEKDEQGFVAGGVTTQTDRDGNFRVENLGGDPPFHVYVQADGHPSLFEVVQDVDRPLMFMLEPGAKLTGLVIDAESRTPVTVFSYSVRGQCGSRRKRQGTSPSGQFEIDGLSGGSCDLFFSAQGYADFALEPVTLQANETRSGLTVALAPGASIWGQVKGAGDSHHRLLVFARHTKSDQSPGRTRSARVGPEGHFQIQDLPAGGYTVGIQGQVQSIFLELQAGEARHDLEIEFER
jgi:protocatechuate 3,4-dioxygenase beta subunit